MNTNWAVQVRCSKCSGYMGRKSTLLPGEVLRELVVLRDVREVQPAKSALRSGIDILLKTAGLSYGDVGAFYISSGAVIGLFPKELSGRMRAVGNSALKEIINKCFNAGIRRKIFPEGSDIKWLLPVCKSSS